MRKYWWSISNDTGVSLDSSHFSNSFNGCVNNLNNSIEIRPLIFSIFAITIYSGEYHKYGFIDCTIEKRFDKDNYKDLLCLLKKKGDK